MNNWEYNPYRASLRLNKKPFALVTPDGKNALSPDQVEILLNDLCQIKHAALKEAIRLHAADMEEIMKGPSTYERGQKIAQSLGRLESEVRHSESTSPRPAPKSASGSSTSATLPLPKAGALTRPAVARPTSSTSSKPSKRTTSSRSTTRE